MDSIQKKYRAILDRIMAKAKHQAAVSEDNVYQEGNASLLPSIDTIIADYLEPDSALRGIEHLKALLDAARSGEACLLLAEHYSNFDLPVLHYLLRKSGPEGEAIAHAIVAVAGIKLSESNPLVHAFTQGYSRVVIYPSRSMEIIKRNLKDPNKLLAEMMRSTRINHAAMKTVSTLKHEGALILVFPAGTRYRPGQPETKQGVREITSYIKSFSKFCLISINGNIFRINPSGEMENDILTRDRMIYTISEPYSCEAFVNEVKKEQRFHDDKKQAIADQIMALLDIMHDEAEKGRLPH